MSRGFRDEDEVEASDLVDITARLIRQSEKAWLISDGGVEVWVPKSQVERDGDTWTLPEWLAMEKGLI